MVALRSTAFKNCGIFPAAWSWTFHFDLAPDATTESEHVWPRQEPASGPADVVEPHRYTVCAVVKVVSGQVYTYYRWKMIGSVTRHHVFYTTSYYQVDWAVPQALLHIGLVDEWWIELKNRSAVNPAEIEGTITLYARGFHFG